MKDKIEVTYNDIEEMGRNATDVELLLRVVEIAAANKTPDCQTWAKENLLKCLNGAKNDVLVLMNLFELLERLDAIVLSSSMEILFQLRHDPIISSMGMSYCSLVKERVVPMKFLQSFWSLRLVKELKKVGLTSERFIQNILLSQMMKCLDGILIC